MQVKEPMRFVQRPFLQMFCITSHSLISEKKNCFEKRAAEPICIMLRHLFCLDSQIINFKILFSDEFQYKIWYCSKQANIEYLYSTRKQFLI